MKKIRLFGVLSLLITTFSIVIATPYSTNAISELVFDWMLLQKSNAIVAQQKKRRLALDSSLKGILDRLDFSCNKKDLQLLQSATINSRYIMLLGLVTKNGQTCTSLGERVSLSLDKTPEITFIDDNLHFIDSGVLTNISNNLMFTYRQPRGTLFSILGSDSFYNVLDKNCEQCFYVEFIINDKIILSVGDKKIKNEFSKKIKTYKTRYDHVGIIQTYAGEALLAYARATVSNANLIFLVALWGGAFTILATLKLRQRTPYQRLKNAIKNGELKLHYQPIFDLTLNKYIGAEILIRWECNGEFISPAQFIPYAEERDLIIPITDYLINKAISETNLIPDDIWYSINISAKHFIKNQLLASINKHNITLPRKFVFELTERHPIEDIDAAKKQITKLEEYGYQFKIDDFGTGYGGVAYIQTLGIRALKIDKMFIDTIGTDDFKFGVLESIIAFGVQSNYELIAEGVETKEQVDFLRAKGVTLHQGYFYAKPMEIAYLSEKINSVKQCSTQN